MKYLEEFQRPDLVKHWSDSIHAITTRPWTVMEVCGGQTHTIVKCGLQALLPKTIRLIHGPGCPVCVTPTHLIDHALHIAAHKETILCSYGDMLRVPGTESDLLTLKAQGADVRIVLSPLDAVKIAQDNPTKKVVFFAVGFETTAPPNAMAVHLAKELGIRNFFLLASHVLVPPALKFLLEAPNNEVQGFLAAGHVCTVMGERHYHSLVNTYQVPIVITGFEPVDILQGLYYCIEMLEKRKPGLVNQYARSVRSEGNPIAQNLLETVFVECDQMWRGIGGIPLSGLALSKTYYNYDAARAFPYETAQLETPSACISGQVMQGKKRPPECPLFGTACTPETPQGAPMVSTEGACAAYFNYATSVREPV